MADEDMMKYAKRCWFTLEKMGTWETSVSIINLYNRDCIPVEI